MFPAQDAHFINKGKPPTFRPDGKPNRRNKHRHACACAWMGVLGYPCYGKRSDASQLRSSSVHPGAASQHRATAKKCTKFNRFSSATLILAGDVSERGFACRHGAMVNELSLPQQVSFDGPPFCLRRLICSNAFEASLSGVVGESTFQPCSSPAQPSQRIT
jgi:hypothetical protein